MKLHYFAHCHRHNLPLLKCLVASVRRFDQESPFVCVMDDECVADACAWTSPEPHVEIVSMSQVERECAPTLPWGNVRATRSPRDTAWTMQACLPWWLMRGTGADAVVYMDTDLFWLQDLRPYIDALPETAHVAICPHHYPAGKENIGAGKFNNGLVWMRNSNVALSHARNWGQWAIEVFEPHEQKHLDTWHDTLGEACVDFPNGLNVGPWQLPSCIRTTDGKDIWSYTGGLAGSGQPSWDCLLQSFHFHELRIDATGNNPVTINGRNCNRTNYPLHPSTIESVYVPYEHELAKYL